MTTQYTTILKLALPVQGELSGTWGDVVNDNITQMVEQAIAGKATVNSWTGNSHTLTTADGTTSESRCAILELTDSGTALTGAGTVVCPTNTKLYIVDNNTAEIVTVKTSGGTGVAVPVGKTMLVYCDGTNVVEGVTHANSLSLGTSTVTADKILDEDNMVSDSATAIATQQSIKAYVDSQVGTVDTLSEILANGNTTGANDIDVDSAQKVQFRDADIYLNSSVDGQLDIVADGEVQIDTALVDINGNLDVSGTTNISGSVSFTKNAIAGVAISTTSRSSNTVTVTTSAVHGLTSGDLVNVNGVADTSFNGYFTVSVSSTTVFTYNQTGSDGSSTGGTSTEVVYNLNASGTALNWMNGPLNIAANSGIDGLEITQSGAGEALSITGGNAIFGDNDKAVFGAGSDLQIYHDGSHSYIDDVGTGNLFIRADNLQLRRASGSQIYLAANTGAEVALYHAGNSKLATTATGIDVTGSVTADGLTVANTGAPALRVQDTDGTNQYIELGNNGGITSYVARNNTTNGSHLFYGYDGTNFSQRFNIANNGDISFYEDTGTTPKLVWKSADERLGIGTSTPSDLLDVSANGTSAIRLSDSSSPATYAQITQANGVLTFTADAGNAQTGSNMQFEVDGTEAMRIDASGNLLVGGTTTPETTGLSIETTSSTGGLNIISPNTGRGDIFFGDTADLNVGQIRYAHSDNSMTFRTNAADALTIDASGRVGIGNSVMSSMFSSSQNLVVGTGSGNNGITVYSQSNAVGDIAFADATSDPAYYSGLIRYDHSLDAMRLFASSDERLRISADGSISTPTAGTNNVRFGNNAGESIASGANSNTLVGDEAGTAITTGDYNAAFGQNALASNVTGSRNTAIGRSALETLNPDTEASYNTAVGYGAGAAVTIGIENTLIGGLAGDALTTGNYNTTLGYKALSSDTAGNRSVAIGREALLNQNFTSSTQSYNVAVGYAAGLAVTTGVNNTLIGGLAGDAITTGSYNSAVGMSALGANTTGASNTAVGQDSLSLNTTGANNVSLGAYTLDANTTASNNTAVGTSALGANNTGASNTAIGYYALHDNTGAVSTALGEYAGRLATGNFNTFIGRGAGYNATTGTQNTFVGVGRYGVSAGVGDAMTTGSKNTILGAYSGNQGGLDIRTTSNNIVLSDGDGNPLAYYHGGLSSPAWHFKTPTENQNSMFFDNTASSNPYGPAIRFTNNDPNDTIRYFLKGEGGGTNRLFIYSNGNITNTNNSYGAISDVKLKENIIDASSQWDDIKALTVRKYSLKADNLDAPNMLGVVAQEVEAAGMGGLIYESPDMDSEHNDLGTVTKQVNYSILYMKAVKALQEAMDRIETLEAKVAALES